jgi:hypothetical protein
MMKVRHVAQIAALLLIFSAPLCAQTGQTVAGCLAADQTTCHALNVDTRGDLIDRPLAQVYTTDLTQNGILALTLATTSTIATASALVTGIYVNNTSTSAVRLYITDASNNYYVGPNYSIAAGANGMLDLIPTGGLVFSGGIRASASVSNALNVQFIGKMSP